MFRTPKLNKKAPQYKPQGSASREENARSAKTTAERRITQIYQQGRRFNPRLPEINTPMNAFNGNNLGDSNVNAAMPPVQPDTLQSVIINNTTPTTSQNAHLQQQALNDLPSTSQANVARPEVGNNNTVVPQPQHEFDNRSLSGRSIASQRSKITDDRRSIATTVVSNVSKTHSAILPLERQKSLREQAFLESQKRQQEIDDFELKMMETQRQQLMQRKLQAEAFLEKQQKFEEEII